MAVTITQVAMAEALGVDAPLAGRLLAVAAALVDRFGPAAPEAIANEAAIRVAGWLAESPSSGVRRESIADISTTFSPAATGALRHSGAMALLSPWKVRRAGVIA